MKRIAFCFLATNQMYNIELWKEYFHSIDQSLFEIYIHAKDKFEVPLPNVNWIDLIPTEWGKVSLVHATYNLFLEASKNCDYFYFLSSDTIPLKPFSFLYQINHNLFSVAEKQDAAHLQFSQGNYRDSNPKLKQLIQFNDWKKQHMFFGLTRESFFKIPRHTIEYVKDICIPDEYYWINICFVYQISYKTEKYIYSNRDCVFNTQSEIITPLIYQNHKHDIENYLFLRKVKNYSEFENYQIPVDLISSTRKIQVEIEKRDCFRRIKDFELKIEFENEKIKNLNKQLGV